MWPSDAMTGWTNSSCVIGQTRSLGAEIDSRYSCDSASVENEALVQVNSFVIIFT